MVSHRHHYIPSFYLKQWADERGKICEYCRHHNLVAAHSKPPKGTGYVDDLYIVHGVAPEAACAIEDEFLKSLDQTANDALQVLLVDDFDRIGRDAELRSGWCRFIMSLLQRNPEKIAWLRQKWSAEYPNAIEKFAAEYQMHRCETDPPTFEEYRS